MAKKTVILLILDGWGIGSHDVSNPFLEAKTPNLDFIARNFPLTTLQASGISVGLPWSEPGNSEVGHLTIGSGQVIYQHYPRIILAIQNGDFFKNQVLLQALNHANQYNSPLHLIGLLTSGIVHASFEHLVALLQLAKAGGVKKVYLHLFTDGRDSGPKEAKNLLDNLQTEINKIKCGRIVSLIGRFYAMDHENEWLRVQRAFKLITQGTGQMARDYQSLFSDIYTDPNFNDSLLEPNIILGDAASPQKEWFINDNDALIFFNFREDGIQELVRAFSQPDFNIFPRPPRKNIFICTLTKVLDNVNLPLAFPPVYPENHLTKILALAQKRQIKIAEASKGAHVTYFFSGLSNDIYPEEYHKILPANPKPIFQDPYMRIREIKDLIFSSLNDNIFDFILANFANPDMVAHLGNFDLAVKTAEIVDSQVGLINQEVLKRKNIDLIITSDHGHLERMRDPITAEPLTEHSKNPVPFYLVSEKFKLKKEKEPEIVENQLRTIGGTLSDIAPTILELLELEKTPDMTGESLIQRLKEGK